MVTTTLDAMQRSGIHDRVGGGFHRYATDRAWRLPHFEKMLYDQAGLLGVYAEAAALTGRVDFAETATGILRYVWRDLRLPSGLIAAAEDADSLAADGPHAGHMHEGAFYTWTPAQLIEALGEEDGLMIARLFGVTEAGNIWDEASGAETGESLLVTTAPIRDLAPAGADPEDFARRIDGLLERLRVARDARPRPLRDDKALADWNGWWLANALRAAALPDAPGQGALHTEDCSGKLHASVRADLDRADDLFTDGGRLAHRVVDGHDSLPAIADDYAFLASRAPRSSRGPARTSPRHRHRPRGPADRGPLGRGTGAVHDRAARHLGSHRQPGRAVRRRDAERQQRCCRCRAAPRAADWARRLRSDRGGGCGRRQRMRSPPTRPASATRSSRSTTWWKARAKSSSPCGANRAGATCSMLPTRLPVRTTSCSESPTPTVPLLRGIAPPLAAYAPPPDGHASAAWAYVCQNFHCEAPVETVEALRALLSDF